MLLLNEEKLSGLSNTKRIHYLFQWLHKLPESIKKCSREELKTKQQTLLHQLQRLHSEGLPPPLRCLLGSAYVTMYSSGSSSSLFDTINKLTDLLKSKDDSTITQIANKLTAIECIGAVFMEHGKMAGPLFPEVVQVLIKSAKVQECRCEVFDCLRRLINGLGSSSSSIHRDVYKAIKSGLTDKGMSVRAASAKCALELTLASTFLYSQELDSASSSCLKALEGSNYEVRCSVAQLLGTTLSLTQKPLGSHSKGKVKLPTLEKTLSILSNGFVWGAGGFLKSGPELLKGSSAGKDVRIGVTQAYVVFLSEMGGVWLERNLPLILHHVLELLSHNKTTSTHIDAVYSRKCVNFILRSSFSKLLGESAQLMAAKQLCQMVAQLCSPTSIPSKTDEGERSLEGGGGGAVSDKSIVAKQHMVVCAILEVGSLVVSLNTSSLALVVGDTSQLSQEQPSSLVTTLTTILSHTNLATRLSGAWCLHCVGVALPSQLSSLVTFFLEKLKGCRGQPEALVGYSYAVAALLSTTRTNNLGVPNSTAEAVFSTGKQLLKSSDNDRLAEACAQSGWALIGAYLTLGPVYIRSQLKVVLSLWHNVFPHSHRELTAELKGGSSSSWTKLLEMRTGALSSISGFLMCCSESLTPDLTKRVMLPLDSALAMAAGIPGLVKSHGVQLKATGAMLRLRLYRCLSLLPPSTYEGSLNNLLRELVADFTLADNMSSTTSSLLRIMCHHDDSILLGSWLEKTDHQDVEEMLQPNSAAGSGALEHDPSSTFLNSTEVTTMPGPLPLGVAVIDAAIILFGRSFPLVSVKHMKQLLTHFKECIRQARSSRQQAMLINIFTAFLAALKGLVEAKISIGEEELISSAYSFIISALGSSEAMLRCAAGEALGRLSQVVGETSFIAQIVQMSVDALKTKQDIAALTGHSLVLGCLHRYVGGMGSGQHLQISVSVLHNLVADTTAPVTQVWALHALALIADCGGPLFRNHVEPTLSLVLSLIIHTPFTFTEIHRCLGKCLSALITTLGPELQINTENMSAMRQTCLSCCSIIQSHPDAVVQSNAISCLQQLQLFIPSLVKLESVVPKLFTCLDSSHLLLRQAAANCLRQFSQQDPERVWSIVSDGGVKKGLEHAVLSKLDIENDQKLRFDLKEILFSLLSSLAPSDPMKWLLLCNGVLSAATQKSGTKERGGGLEREPHQQEQKGEDMDEDMAKFTSAEEISTSTEISPRWPTKVFAVECSRKIYLGCKNDPAHFNLTLALLKQRSHGGDYLVKHLAELVRTSFIAATASVDQLKLAGYQALQDVIELFASSVDPDYPGHFLLEQYQAQIGAALRPAFSNDTTPHVTAMACQVCSKWLGSAVSQDVGDLRRVQTLLVSSLDKLMRGKSEGSLYGEAVRTMESIAVLKAWAELYIKVSEAEMLKDDQSLSEDTTPSSAMGLIEPHLSLLSQYWLAALKDYALLSLPAQFSSQLPHEDGTFYSPNVASIVLPYYVTNWPSLLHAAAIWAQTLGLNKSLKEDKPSPALSSVPAFAGMVPLNSALANPVDERRDLFHLLMGLAVQVLCTPSAFDSQYSVQSSLHALLRLLDTQYSHETILTDKNMISELLSLFHRLLLTCQFPSLQLTTLRLAMIVGSSLSKTSWENSPEEEVMEHGKSLPYSLLEIASCSLFILVPDLAKKGSGRATKALSSVEMEIVTASVQLLPTVIGLCSEKALSQVLGPILYMILSTIRYISVLPAPPKFTSIVQTVQLLCSKLTLTTPTNSTLHDAVWSLLDSRNDPGENCLNEIPAETRLVLVAMLLLCPAAVCKTSSPLSAKCVEFFKACIKKHKQPELQLKALQTCEALFSCQCQSALVVLLIHDLGPVLVEVVMGREAEGRVIIRSTQLLELLLDKTPDDKKTVMMGLLVPLLISLLIPPEQLRMTSKTKRAVHDHTLQRLTQIGPKYPTAFRSIMSSSPGLKTRLEAAVRSQSTKRTVHASTGANPQQTLQPAIKLKMDFSNFK